MAVTIMINNNNNNNSNTKHNKTNNDNNYNNDNNSNINNNNNNNNRIIVKTFLRMRILPVCITRIQMARVSPDPCNLNSDVVKMSE